MMKLLLAVIATCALVVSPTCIKIKHQLRSNAPTIHVLISNGNTQMTSQVGRNGSHRFITDNLSNMTLAPAGSQTIQLSYDEIFPITDAAVCTEVHPLSAGGCADGVCCKVSISMYTITDAIIMTARVNNRNADGNPQFWKCEQEIQVPGVTNTELSPEELVTDILHGESPGTDCSSDVNACGISGDTHLACDSGECVCVSGYVPNGDVCSKECTSDSDCYQPHGKCEEVSTGYADSTYKTCVCKSPDPFGNGFRCANNQRKCSISTSQHCVTENTDVTFGACDYGYEMRRQCVDINECDDPSTHDCHDVATCTNTDGSYTCACDSGYYGDGFTCTACETCVSHPPVAQGVVVATYCSSYADSPTNACCLTCAYKVVNGDDCTENNQCLSNYCCLSNDCSTNTNKCLACTANTCNALGDFHCNGADGYCYHN